ncbi:hypothetical protein FACS1894132_13220 [Clostridia bacterium]|nr:hypothetical protein FACS1894132_13220 [Clostridia bacterium]
MNKYKNYDFYFTGHSLGGNLAYNGGAKALSIDSGRVKRIVTFNGLGLMPTASLISDGVDSLILDLNKIKITNYIVENDPVQKIPLDFHFGNTIKYPKSKEAIDEHNIYTFLDNIVK